MNCFFVSDLHGRVARYEKLFASIVRERPDLVLIGGDILPHALHDTIHQDFLCEFLCANLRQIRQTMGDCYPPILLVLGNDDPRSEEAKIIVHSEDGLFHYLHGHMCSLSGFEFYGYACVPPTPFLLKDWERYDVSRYVAPGALSPEEGCRTLEAPEHEIKWGTIQRDLDALVNGASLKDAVFLFHTPPYDTPLDVAALDGQYQDHVPLDPHVGSIAVRRFIEARQPRMTLHGHIHESARLSGSWKTTIGQTVCVTAAHDGPELALVRFDPRHPNNATRELI